MQGKVDREGRPLSRLTVDIDEAVILFDGAVYPTAFWPVPFVEPVFISFRKTNVIYSLAGKADGSFIPSAGKADGSLLPLAEAAERSILTLPRWAPISANPR